MISAPREAAAGFPRLCYAYFSFAMTQWDSDDYDDDDDDDKVGLEDIQVERGGETGA